MTAEESVQCRYPAWLEKRMQQHREMIREAEQFLERYDKPMALDGLRVVKGESK